MGVRLEILETGVPPLLGVGELHVEERVGHLPLLLMSFHVFLGAGVPEVPVGFYHGDTHVVSHAEFLPESTARVELVVPRYMVEP